jgi:hypothetical protein
MYTRVVDPDSMTLWIRIHWFCGSGSVSESGSTTLVYSIFEIRKFVHMDAASIFINFRILNIPYTRVVDPDPWWIRTQWLCGSGFTDNVVLDPYPDPDWPKLLDPDPYPDPDWINPDPLPCCTVYNILCIGLQMCQSRKESRIIFSYRSRSHINTDGSYGGLQKRFSSYSTCVVDPHCYVAPQHLYEWGAIF